jgi:hypothetical protein
MRHRANFKKLGMCESPIGGDIETDEDESGIIIVRRRRRNPIRAEDIIRKEDTDQWT